MVTQRGENPSCCGVGFVHAVDIDLQLVSSHAARHNDAKRIFFQNIAALACSFTVDRGQCENGSAWFITFAEHWLKK
jgi:hypothetical protein